jgi:hypothetical protein
MIGDSLAKCCLEHWRENWLEEMEP